MVPSYHGSWMKCQRPKRWQAPRDRESQGDTDFWLLVGQGAKVEAYLFQKLPACQLKNLDTVRVSDRNLQFKDFENKQVTIRPYLLSLEAEGTTQPGIPEGFDDLQCS